MTRVRTAARRWPVATACIAAAMLAAAGCATSPSKQLADARSLYDQGQYDKSLAAADEARASVEGGTGSKDASLRAEAAYVAGMSASKLNDLPIAEQRLAIAAASDDPDVAGRAYAQLGGIKFKQRRYRDAASDYDEAAKRLEGEDAAKARAEASAALRQLGSAAPVAGSPPSSAGSRAPAGAASASGAPASPSRTASSAGWTLQGGCFRDRANAERSAKTLSSATVAKGLGPARVVPVAEGNGTLFCVMIGEYPTRELAEAAKRKLDRTDVFSRSMP